MWLRLLILCALPAWAALHKAGLKDRGVERAATISELLADEYRQGRLSNASNFADLTAFFRKYNYFLVPINDGKKFSFIYTTLEDGSVTYRSLYDFTAFCPPGLNREDEELTLLPKAKSKTVLDHPECICLYSDEKLGNPASTYALSCSQLMREAANKDFLYREEVARKERKFLMSNESGFDGNDFDIQNRVFYADVRRLSSRESLQNDFQKLWSGFIQSQEFRSLAKAKNFDSSYIKKLFTEIQIRFGLSDSSPKKEFEETLNTIISNTSFRDDFKKHFYQHYKDQLFAITKPTQGEVFLYRNE